jgi:DNA-binding transcriptional LysR family regulator
MQDLRNLWYFLQISRAGSLTAAAQRLSLSTAALSKSLAGLEKRMNVQLFVRTARTLQLTDEGRALVAKLAGAFETIEESYHDARYVGRKPAGLVRVSSVTAYGKHCVLPLLPRFFAQYPEIDLQMSLHDGGRGLTRQGFDVRINWGEEREQDKVSQTLCQMPLILVASPEYLARRGTPRSPAELEAHDCINVALANGTRARWTFLPRGRPARDASRLTVMPKGRLIIMDELDAVKDAAVAGLGLTVSSAENVLAELRAGLLVRVLEDYRIVGESEKNSEIIMQYAQRPAMSQKVRVFVDFLLGELKGRNPLDVVQRSG